MDKLEQLSGELSTSRIKEWRASGKKALGIVCCHAPFEMLHAAGVLPVRLRSTGCKSCAEGAACVGDDHCGFLSSILQYLIDGTYELDGLVTSNGCGESSSVITNWKIITTRESKSQFLYEVVAPKMVNTASYDYFSSELDELREELEKFTGNQITNEKLKKSVDIYNEARRLVKQIYDLHKAEHPVISGAETLKVTLAATQMTIEEYIEFLKDLLDDLKSREPITDFSARVMLAGSALDDPEYVKAIEDCGLLVVADLNSFGLRFLHDELPYDEKDVAGSIAKYYLTRSSCPRMMDGSDDIHDYILAAAGEYKVDGVIIVRMQHCGKWDVETYVLESLFKEKGIPSISLERQVLMSQQGQLQLRVEAFRELLESRQEE
ncbi:MAG: 2-hydroxyacyl-CoA dehydratase family protein [Oscillospiraceae bacterium]|nr:2-hydroxyacyl-CoA dehydratase family protein [Oscillospiraceae bacterium]